MATESGVEGKMFFATDGNYEFKVFGWTLESLAILGEDTNGTTGGHEHRALIKLAHKLTADVFVDDGGEGLPETIASDTGIHEGEEARFSLRTGTLKWYNQWTFIIESITIKGCDPNGLVSYQVVAHAQDSTKPDLDDEYTET